MVEAMAGDLSQAASQTKACREDQRQRNPPFYGDERRITRSTSPHQREDVVDSILSPRLLKP
jgi:hypothetical protein